MIKKILGLLTLMILLTGAMAYGNPTELNGSKGADIEIAAYEGSGIVYSYDYLGIEGTITKVAYEEEQPPVKVDYDNDDEIINVAQLGIFTECFVEITYNDGTEKKLTLGISPYSGKNFVIAKGAEMPVTPRTMWISGLNPIQEMESTYENALEVVNDTTVKANTIDGNMTVGLLLELEPDLVNLNGYSDTAFRVFHIRDIEPQLTYNVGETFDILDFVGVKDNQGNTLNASSLQYYECFVPDGYLDEWNKFTKAGLITVCFCDEGEMLTFTVEVTDEIPVELVLIEGELEAYVGKTSQLEAIIIPDDATDKRVEWESSDPSIATVDQNGLVTAIKKGSVDISCTSVSRPDCGISVTFFVKQPVEKVVLNTHKLELIKWNKATLKATVLPRTASNKDVEWISYNKNVATVNSKGVVRGVGEGTAKIICRSADNHTALDFCDVTVAKVRVNIVPNKVGVRRGKSVKVVANVTPNFDYVNQNVRWISSNPKIATVNQFGVITGINKGTCKVKAISLYDGKTYDTIKVGVVNK